MLTAATGAADACASATAVGQLAKVIIEHSHLDLPPPTEPHMRDPVIDDELSQRRPRHANMLRSLLTGEPDRWLGLRIRDETGAGASTMSVCDMLGPMWERGDRAIGLPVPGHGRRGQTWTVPTQRPSFAREQGRDRR
jgi:hypothetical protein